VPACGANIKDEQVTAAEVRRDAAAICKSLIRAIEGRIVCEWCCCRYADEKSRKLGGGTVPLGAVALKRIRTPSSRNPAMSEGASPDIVSSVSKVATQPKLAVLAVRARDQEGKPPRASAVRDGAEGHRRRRQVI